MSQNISILERLLKEKRDLLRLFTIATVLAFAVGSLGSLFAAQKAISEWSIVCVSVCLIIVSFGLLARDLYSILLFQDEIDGVLFIDTEVNELVPVKDYVLSEELTEIMRAVKAESKSIYADWEKDPLIPVPQKEADKPERGKVQDTPSYFTIIKIVQDQQKESQPKSVDLLEEAAAFVLLEQLSLHLSAYFNDSGEDSYIKEYSRNDIPDFLLKNRVLNLLSTPIEQRDIFLNVYPDGIKRPEGEVYSLYGSDGAVYSRFEMVLPKGSSIRHSGKVGINIETRRLSLELCARYTGTCAVVSSSFVARYLGKDPNKIECRDIHITLKGRIKPMSLLIGQGWQYYRWLDSFREKAQASFSFYKFLSDIHWPVIEPLLFSMRKSSRTLKSVRKGQAENGQPERKPDA